MTNAMTGVVQTLEPDKARTRQLVAENYSTMIELTDTLIRETGLDFHEAHEVIARVVGTALGRKLAADEIDAALVR